MAQLIFRVILLFVLWLIGIPRTDAPRIWSVIAIDAKGDARDASLADAAQLACLVTPPGLGGSLPRLVQDEFSGWLEYAATQPCVALGDDSRRARITARRSTGGGGPRDRRVRGKTE